MQKLNYTSEKLLTQCIKSTIIIVYQVLLSCLYHQSCEFIKAIVLADTIKQLLLFSMCPV